jgi:hypothetical protein
MKYVWRGPTTTIEVWSGEVGSGDLPPTLVVSELAVEGRPITADLDAEHPTVAGWLAFGLIAPVSEPRRKTKENADG